MKKISLLGIIFLVMAACSPDASESEIITSADARGNASQNAPVQLLPPYLDCGEVSETSWKLAITGNSTHGAPAGFKLEWMTADDYEAAGDKFTDAACSFRFSNADHQLSSNQTVQIDLAQFVSDEEGSCFPSWHCEQDYAFRVRAENPQGNTFRSSEWSSVYFCQTHSCSFCLFGYGYWKNHGPESPGNQENTWPLLPGETLMVGHQELTQAEIYQLLISNGNDPVLKLKQHLIATKFNILLIGNSTGIQEQVTLADNMIDNQQNYTKHHILEVKDALENFNESSPCED